VRSFALHKLNLLPLLDRFAIWGPLSLEPKRTLRSGCPKEFFWGVEIAKRPEIARSGSHY